MPTDNSRMVFFPSMLAKLLLFRKNEKTFQKE